MNQSFADAMAAQLATLTRVAAVPAGELKYGRDLSCTTELDPQLAEVDPASTDAIAEAVIRRYLTPRGALGDDPDYGLHVVGHLNRGVTVRDLRALSGVMRAEALKDDRVAECEVRIDSTLGAREMNVTVRITPADPALRDFSLTFAVSDSAVLMVTIDG